MKSVSSVDTAGTTAGAEAFERSHRPASIPTVALTLSSSAATITAMRRRDVAFLPTSLAVPESDVAVVSGVMGNSPEHRARREAMDGLVSSSHEGPYDCNTPSASSSAAAAVRMSRSDQRARARMRSETRSRMPRQRRVDPMRCDVFGLQDRLEQQTRSFPIKGPLAR